MANGKWKTVRPNVAQFYGVHVNVMRRAHTSGAEDEVYFATTLLDYEFEYESGDASINLNVDAGDDEEDEVEELAQPMGRDKAKGSKKKGVGSSGSSSSMNDKALTRLMVSELSMHNKRSMAMEKEEHLAYLEMRKRDVEIHERELAMQEYKQRQKDIMLYM
nr:hypothetical protein [Tanacetum cinerariifolium]